MVLLTLRQALLKGTIAKDVRTTAMGLGNKRIELNPKYHGETWDFTAGEGVGGGSGCEMTERKHPE